MGATEVEPDTICNNAGHVALDYVYGTSLDGFDPRTARDSAYTVESGRPLRDLLVEQREVGDLLKLVGS